MKRLFFLIVTLVLLSNCFKQKYIVINTLDNGAIVGKMNLPYRCRGVLCSDEYTYQYMKRYYFENIEGITYYDGYTFEIPEDYVMVDKGIIKYTPKNAQSMTVPWKGFKKRKQD